MYAQLSLLIVSLHLFILAKYHAQLDHEKFNIECDYKTFNCGENMTEIGYPFWGGDRPEDCGLPGLKLSCENEENEQFAMLDIGSNTKFRVRYINTSSGEIKMERAYAVSHDDCPQEFEISANFNETFFDYGGDTNDLHLIYDCPPGINAPVLNSIRKNFTCAMSSSYKAVGFFGDETLLYQFPNLQACKIKIRVPVNRTALEEFKSNVKMELQDLLNPSFVVFYKINEVMCSACKNSDGLCWPECPKSALAPAPAVAKDKVFTLLTASKSRTPLKIGIGLGSAAFGIACTVLAFFFYNRRKNTKHGSSLFSRNISSDPSSISDSEKGGTYRDISCLGKYLPNNLVAFGKTKSDKDVEAFIRQYGFSTPKRYRYSTLKIITNSFKHELGKGGYGNVYQGKLPDGRVVAVKVLNVSKGKGEEFINEVASIGRTSHVNIVTLLGFCYEGKRRALIYEFMPNGSLEKFIHGKTSPMGGQHLGYEKLYNIALGIARGLEYLHQGCKTRIVHFDIKPHNILLDEDFCPKISDFGLAKLYTRKESIISMMEARGTIGYIAPEVFSRNFGEVSHKSDVYSYGMMILEMVGGRKNVDVGAINTSEIYFPHWIYKHIELNEELNLVSATTIEENEIARKMIVVGLWCIQTNPSQRPSISKVIELLEGSIAALEIPPKPYLCSPRQGSNS